jgi:hypothetical protein
LVREAAIKKVTNQAVLLEVSKKDSSHIVRGAAEECVSDRSLLASAPQGRPSKSPREMTDEEIFGRLSSVSRELREWKIQDGTPSLEKIKETARKLGEELNRRGGMELMLHAHQRCDGGRALEGAWDRIGEWRG